LTACGPLGVNGLLVEDTLDVGRKRAWLLGEDRRNELLELVEKGRMWRRTGRMRREDGKGGLLRVNGLLVEDVGRRGACIGEGWTAEAVEARAWTEVGEGRGLLGCCST
jgi:hypothetical protein